MAHNLGMKTAPNRAPGAAPGHTTTAGTATPGHTGSTAPGVAPGSHGQASKPGSPTPAAVRAHRLAHGQTQSQAAALIYMELRAWQKYEAGDSAMHPAFFELYRIKCAMQ